MKNKLLNRFNFKKRLYKYSLSNLQTIEVDEFDINSFKRGDVFIRTHKKELIQETSTKNLIQASEELENNNMCILIINSKFDVQIEI